MKAIQSGLGPKFCPRCSTEKPITDFYFRRGGPVFACKPCYSVHNKEMRAKHAEKRKAYDAARGSGWERSGREKYKAPEAVAHDNYLKATYGISLADYERMLLDQGGLCAICRRPETRSTTTRFCVDHCHLVGTVRGLLCFQCNVGLGKFKDDPKILAAAIAYLMKDPS